MTETRKDFLAWAKAQTLEYVDQGDFEQAWASLVSDLGKNPDVYDRSAPGVRLMIESGMAEIKRSPEAMRHWIEGFN